MIRLSKKDTGFALWITGLPASGKTVLAMAVKKRLEEWCDINIVHLESDSLRKILTPEPTYSREERDWFYRILTFIGCLLTKNGVHVIFDATGNKKIYRDRARSSIEKFIEVYVKCPMDVCISRDPKGLYKKAMAGDATTVPGIQDIYEEPEDPDVIVNSDRISPEEGAEHIIARLKERGWI